MRPTWIIRRAARFGRGMCRLHRRFPTGPEMMWGLKHPKASTQRCLGFPVPLLYQLARKVGSLLLAVLRFNRRRVFRAAWALSYVWGYTLEARES